MSDWIDQNTFISDDGKVVRNGFYRDRDGALRAYFGPKPINQPPSWPHPGAPSQGQDKMFVGSPAPKPAPRSYQGQQLGSLSQEQDTTFERRPAAKPAPRSNQGQSQGDSYEPDGSGLSIEAFLSLVIAGSIFFGLLALLMMGR